MTRIYTRRGDQGETALFGGARVAKDALRVEAYGNLDELNSALGVARAFLGVGEVAAVVDTVQHDLFALGAEIASPGEASAHVPRVQPSQVEALEGIIDRFEATLPPLRTFILPGGSQAASFLHLARTVCRRAERSVVTLTRSEPVNPEILRYLNRLSDLLFVLARSVNRTWGALETPWTKEVGGTQVA